MRKAKNYILLLISLAVCSSLFAQKDSIQALFQPPKFNIHYSYLQWELGYNGFVFNNDYIDGVGFDGIGLVFNEDVDIAIGLDQGGRPYGGYGGRGAIFSNLLLQSYTGFYLKIEPMLFPDKVINLSMPIKLDFSSLSYTDTASINSGHHHHNRPLTFPAVIPGVFGWVNVFPKVSLGIGVSYRIALKTDGVLPGSDYSNFVFSGMIRLKLFTRSHTKQAAKQNNYYAPPVNRFQ